MKIIPILLTVMALSACSSMKTSSDYDPKVDFSEVKTYAWIERKTQETVYHLDGLMDQRVRSAVDRQLQLKGLTKVTANSADVLVNYLTKIDKKINVDSFNSSFGYHPYYGSAWGSGMVVQTRVREYEVGTLILDLVDRKSGQLIWRGSVADTLRNKSTPEQRTEVINTAIMEMLSNYPPKLATD